MWLLCVRYQQGWPQHSNRGRERKASCPRPSPGLRSISDILLPLYTHKRTHTHIHIHTQAHIASWWVYTNTQPLMQETQKQAVSWSVYTHMQTHTHTHTHIALQSSPLSNSWCRPPYWNVGIDLRSIRVLRSPSLSLSLSFSLWGF